MVQPKRFVLSLVIICGFIFVYHFPTPAILENESMLYIKRFESAAYSEENLDNGKGNTKLNSGVQIKCNDILPQTYYEQRGDYWVLTNYFMAEKTFHCNESITYTTHAEFIYLDNLSPLLERWQGPLSISVYAPGSDFTETLKRIKYLRDCSQNAKTIKMFASFHIFFDAMHMPEEKNIPRDPEQIKIDCSIPNPLLEENVTTYRRTNNLTYPINMGRMIARDLSTTFYVLPSDIELYPSPNVIQPFLEMIRRNDKVLQSANPKVFVLSIFEADASVDPLPYNKTELIKLVKAKKVIPFHKFVCPYCHRVPQGREWFADPIKDGMNIFHVAKREGSFKFWEPIYIGTKLDPGYDIRLNWEGQRDKMTQGFILKTLDYEFHILDNAFLIHRPGIKRWPSKRTPLQNKAGYRQNRLIDRKIYPELRKLYGENEKLESNDLRTSTSQYM